MFLVVIVTIVSSCSRNSERFRKQETENFNATLPKSMDLGSYDRSVYEGNGRYVDRFTVNESKFNLDKAADLIKQRFISSYKKVNNVDKDDALEELDDDAYMILIVRGSESGRIVKRTISNEELRNALSW